jgi:hypothetical protein
MLIFTSHIYLSRLQAPPIAVMSGTDGATSAAGIV